MPKAFDISCRFPHGDLVYNVENEYVATRDFKGPIHVSQLNPDEEIIGWLLDGKESDPRMLLMGKPFELYHNITTKIALCELDEGITGNVVLLTDRLLGYFVENSETPGRQSRYIRFTWLLSDDIYDFRHYIVNGVNRAIARLHVGLKVPATTIR